MNTDETRIQKTIYPQIDEDFLEIVLGFKEERNSFHPLIRASSVSVRG
jgi:hypothetical protein